MFKKIDYTEENGMITVVVGGNSFTFHPDEEHKVSSDNDGSVFYRSSHFPI